MLWARTHLELHVPLHTKHQFACASRSTGLNLSFRLWTAANFATHKEEAIASPADKIYETDAYRMQ